MDPEIGMMEQWSGRGRIEDDRIEEAAADKVGADKTQFGTKEERFMNHHIRACFKSDGFF